MYNAQVEYVEQNGTGLIIAFSADEAQLKVDQVFVCVFACSSAKLTCGVLSSWGNIKKKKKTPGLKKGGGFEDLVELIAYPRIYTKTGSVSVCVKMMSSNVNNVCVMKRSFYVLHICLMCISLTVS